MSDVIKNVYMFRFAARGDISYENCITYETLINIECIFELSYNDNGFNNLRAFNFYVAERNLDLVNILFVDGTPEYIMGSAPNLSIYDKLKEVFVNYNRVNKLKELNETL